VLLNCLMYKMCYYRFGQVYTEASEWFVTVITVTVNTYCFLGTPLTVLSLFLSNFPNNPEGWN
jgi:hypothetical protein